MSSQVDSSPTDDLSGASLLVCGGAGFIGSHFARHMLAKYSDIRVTVLDALTYAGNLSTLADLRQNPRFNFVAGKIQDQVVVDGTLEAFGITHMVNFAAESHNDRSILDPGSFIQTDVFGTFVLCESARKFSLQKFVHVSTDEVYGSIATGAFTEESPIEPNTPYSASKAGGDLQCRAQFITYRTPVCVTRGGNNYGPYQYPEKLIPFFVTRLLNGKKVPIYGDGSQVREWVHVLDHCSGIETVLLNGILGEVYNIGDSNERTNSEVVKVLLEETGRDESYIKFIEDPRKGAHDKRYSMTTDKVEQLGWKPTHDFEVELRNTVKWYAENESWWRPIEQSESYQSFVKSYYGRLLGDDL